MTTQHRASHSYASLWMLVAVAGLDHVRWLAGPHFLLPTPLTLHPALPESCPHLRAPPITPPSVCQHGPSVSPPCPAPTPSLRGCLPRPPSCLQCDSGLFVGLPFPKGCQHLGPPPSPHGAPPVSLPPFRGSENRGWGFHWEPRLQEQEPGCLSLPPVAPSSVEQTTPPTSTLLGCSCTPSPCGNERQVGTRTVTWPCAAFGDSILSSPQLETRLLGPPRAGDLPTWLPEVPGLSQG